MMNLCLRYIKNEQDAVDALNNGFLKVFRNLQRYDPDQASLYTWIRTVVVRSCLDAIRASQKIQEHEELVNNSGDNIQPSVIAKLDASELMNIIRKLQPATRAVFNLYVVDGYTHKEIASMLGVSEGTSKWHLSEARKNLKQMLRGELNKS